MLKNDVVVINRNFEKVPTLQFRPSIIDWDSLEDRLFWSIVFFTVFFSDHSIIPLFGKIFLVCIVWLTALILEERRILNAATAAGNNKPHRAYNNHHQHTSSSSSSPSSIGKELGGKYNNSNYQSVFLSTGLRFNQRHAASSSISIVQCEFYIPTVKILEPETASSSGDNNHKTHSDSCLRNDHLWNLIQGSSATISPNIISTIIPDATASSEESGSSSATASHIASLSNADFEHDEDEDIEKQRSVLLSKRIMFKISIVCNNNKRWDIWYTYYDCVQAYNQVVRKYPTQYVPKLASFRRVKRNFFRDVANGNATLSSSTPLNTLQQIRNIEDDKELLQQHQFLQYLQIALLQWLTLLRSSFELGDDEIITSFLHIPQSAKPTLGFSDQHACVVPLILEPVDQTNFPDIIPEEDDDEEPEQWQAAEEVVAAMEDAEADKIFEAEFGIKYKGVTVETFEFLDLSEALRGMVSDSRYTHGFKVRGLTYMDDKKKVEAGPAMAKLVSMDMFIVDVDKFGDRHDHICAYGKAKKRMEILSKRLKDLYFLYVYNLQIPGDPPYSMVFYFAIAKDIIKRGSTMLKAKKLFDRFIDIPITEGDHLGLEEHVPLQDMIHPLEQGETTTTTTQESKANEDSERVSSMRTVFTGADLDYGVIGEAKVIVSKSPVVPSVPSTEDVLEDSATLSAASSTIPSVKIEDVPSTSPSNESSERQSLSPVQPTETAASPMSNDENNTVPTPIMPSSTTTTTSQAPVVPPVNTTIPGTATTTTVAPTPASATQNPQPTTRKNVTQKSWASDIVWPEVGEPGVYDKKSFQNLRYKLVPKLLEAPWVLQMAIRSQPVIVGQKVVQRYFRGSNYIEVDLHVGSSSISNHIVSLCRTYSKSFVCNIGVVLQGENEDELPEEVLACACINRIDFEKAENLES